MRTLVLATVSAAAILWTGAVTTNRAEAMFADSMAVGSAAEEVAPVQNVWWCGWGCHRFHHRHVFFFHRRHVFFRRGFHHRFAFAHRCTWC